MKTVKNRRRKSRFKVAVLVRCAIPKFGEEQFELEMWAKDVNEQGLQLEFPKGLNIGQIQDGDKGGDNRKHSIRFDDLAFKKGLKIRIQDLFYDDDGSPFIEGEISWARHVATSGNWLLGIKLTDPKKHSKELMRSFKDFLNIVKNPIEAIERASRK